MKRWAINCLATGLAAALAAGCAGPAAAQPPGTYQFATQTFQGVANRYNDPLGAPRNVCFSAASLHRWCRVFVASSGGPCVCGGGTSGGAVFAGTLITDSQLYEFIGEDVKQAQVGSNGRRVAATRAYNGF